MIVRTIVLIKNEKCVASTMHARSIVNKGKSIVYKGRLLAVSLFS